MKIAITYDHAGVDLAAMITEKLKKDGHEVLDLGAKSKESVDYNEYVDALAKAILDKKAESGIVICGSGIGVSMAANRHKGIRAALCHDVTTSRLARQHNDANVLALGARLIGCVTAFDCVDTFLKTEFEGGRHEQRVKKLG